MNNSVCDLTDFKEAQRVVYKRVKGRELELVYCLPEQEDKPCTAVVWIHGGGLTGGRAEDYIPHCRFFAEAGIVGISVEYRLLSDEVTVEDCIADAADAVRYIRLHAGLFGIDPKRIAVVGESAGGYLATALVTVAEDSDGCSRPDAVVNCNGVVDLTGAFMYFVSPESHVRPEEAAEEVKKRAKELSPLYHVGSSLPPLLNLQGKRDRTVEPGITEAFHRAYREKGGNSEIVLWEDAAHAFLVIGYTATRRQIDRAMAEIWKFVRQEKW